LQPANSRQYFADGVHDEAMAGRPMQLDAEGRARPDYFDGYYAGEADRLSKTEQVIQKSKFREGS
jgi:hypothetical protein